MDNNMRVNRVVSLSTFPLSHNIKGRLIEDLTDDPYYQMHHL